MSDKKKKSADEFRLLFHHSCDCNSEDCKELLRRYCGNELSCFPNNKKKLLFRLNNPSKSASTQPTRQKHKQQVYDRAALLLKVKNPQDMEFIHIGINHFSPIIIDHYNNDTSSKKEKVFTDYLLPTSLVSNSRLGVKFTDVDKFNCIGTSKLAKGCKKNGSCICNRFLNVPFVTVASSGIVDTGSARGKRQKALSDKRKSSMAITDVQVQKNKADRFQAKNDRMKTKVKETEESLIEEQSKLEGLRKVFANAKEMISMLSPLKRKVASLQEDKDKLKEKEEVTAKRAKKYYDISQKSYSPLGIPEDEIKSLGLCRQSLLDRYWHEMFPEASRSLLNFESFDECMGYIGVLFPQLREEIGKLKELGAKQYVNSRKYLSPLEQCMLCRLSPKTGINGMQIGFIYGIKEGAVSKIKAKWMPLWGYAGKMLTDLELYSDYVEKERPDAYYVNDLPNVGTQCDGKDFLCDSFRKSSALNRAQHSSKMKAPALRCITWSSLCGLVWCFTPLVLARATENAIVQWCGAFSSLDDMYVPVSKSDWQELSDDEDNQNNNDGDDDDDNEFGGSTDDGNVFEETVVMSYKSVDEYSSQMDQSEDEDDDDDNDNDERIKECYDDMDDMSLSVCSDDDDDDDDDEGCFDIDTELTKFNDELHHKGKEKKLVSKNLLRVEDMKAMAKAVLESGPDKNGKTKLDQLEILQELHIEYEACRLKKCLLSMYLKLTLEHRKKLIEQLRMFRDGKIKDPPKIPRRLAKLPALLKVLADRGFANDSLSYPHFNDVITPEFYDKESKQFSLPQLQRDRKICELRYTCEVVFSRVTTEKIVSGVIPYLAFAHIEHAHCWAHAQANLRQPLQMPGSKAAEVLGNGYFD